MATQTAWTPLGDDAISEILRKDDAAGVAFAGKPLRSYFAELFQSPDSELSTTCWRQWRRHNTAIVSALPGSTRPVARDLQDYLTGEAYCIQLASSSSSYAGDLQLLTLFRHPRMALDAVVHALQQDVNDLVRDIRGLHHDSAVAEAAPKARRS